jgi:hypothetical protein
VQGRRALDLTAAAMGAFRSKHVTQGDDLSFIGEGGGF